MSYMVRRIENCYEVGCYVGSDAQWVGLQRFEADIDAYAFINYLMGGAGREPEAADWPNKMIDELRGIRDALEELSVRDFAK